MTGASQSQWPLSWISRWHRATVHGRRTRVLAEMLAPQIPPGASVLDIGCGDGTIASLIAQLRPDISIQGVEFLVRPECKIACQPFDGVSLPFTDRSFDVCQFVDVLHHTKDVRILLREAARVTRTFVLIKDHLSDQFLAGATLRVMDWVANRPYGVPLAYNYQTRCQWSEHFAACGLDEAHWTSQIPLYPAPLSLVFGREMHFVALLRKKV
jgi:SAM-dependent methyltransferase